MTDRLSTNTPLESTNTVILLAAPEGENASWTRANYAKDYCKTVIQLLRRSRNTGGPADVRHQRLLLTTCSIARIATHKSKQAL